MRCLDRRHSRAPRNRRDPALAAALAALSEQRRVNAALVDRALRAGEMERTRFAIELHDGPIQRLASVAYVLDATAMVAETAPALASLARLRARIGAEVDELRRIMAELRPPALDEGGLAAALREYLAAWGPEHAVGTKLVDHLGENGSAGAADIALYRVVQEALANVAKHARASRVEVVLDVRDGGIEVTVTDDGVGFDEAALARSRDHFGLDAIRERMANAGGTARVESRPGEGTVVVARASFPLEDSHA